MSGLDCGDGSCKVGGEGGSNRDLTLVRVLANGQTSGSDPYLSVSVLSFAYCEGT